MVRITVTDRIDYNDLDSGVSYASSTTQSEFLHGSICAI